MATYSGHCHCGKVSFNVNADLDASFRCNCSFCVRRAATMNRVASDQFQLNSRESDLGVYGNRDFSKHYFCKHCGIHCFTRINRNDQHSVAVNIGCLDGVDSLSIEAGIYDGANKL